MSKKKTELYTTHYMPTEQECLWGMMAHVSVLCPVAGPALIYTAMRDESQFVADQAKEAINLHIAMVISVVVCWMTCLLAPFSVFFIAWGLGMAVLAGVEAKRGAWHRYTFIFHLFK